MIRSLKVLGVVQHAERSIRMFSIAIKYRKSIRERHGFAPSVPNRTRCMKRAHQLGFVTNVSKGIVRMRHVHINGDIAAFVKKFTRWTKCVNTAGSVPIAIQFIISMRRVQQAICTACRVIR